MSLEQAPKSPDEAKKALEAMSVDKLKNLSGVQEIIQHLKKGDWAGMVGAVMALWTEYFGTDEEKAELAKKRAEAKKDEVKGETQDKLGDLKGEVQKTDEEAKDEIPSEAELATKASDIPPLTDTIFIGDSLLKGARFMLEKGKRPDFIGESGYASMKTLEALKQNTARLKGKKRALIYTGGNNVAYTPPDKIVGHMIEMAQICEKAGIPEITICTRFPNDPRRESKMIEKSAKLREALLKAHKEGKFPSGVRIADLYKRFAGEDGNLQAKYVRQKSTDYIHPRGAYIPALSYILSSKSQGVA